MSFPENYNLLPLTKDSQNSQPNECAVNESSGFSELVSEEICAEGQTSECQTVDRFEEGKLPSLKALDRFYKNHKVYYLNRNWCATDGIHPGEQNDLFKQLKQNEIETRISNLESDLLKVELTDMNEGPQAGGAADRKARKELKLQIDEARIELDITKKGGTVVKIKPKWTRFFDNYRLKLSDAYQLLKRGKRGY